MMSAKMHAFQGPVSGEPENEVTREARRERINAIKAELRTLTVNSSRRFLPTAAQVLG